MFESKCTMIERRVLSERIGFVDRSVNNRVAGSEISVAAVQFWVENDLAFADGFLVTRSVLGDDFVAFVADIEVANR